MSLEWKEIMSSLIEEMVFQDPSYHVMMASASLLTMIPRGQKEEGISE